jgi:DNA-binding response OmpR family regulator
MEWAATQIGPDMGIEIKLVELDVLLSRREPRFSIGLILDTRALSARDLNFWVSDWRRIDGDWPVALIVRRNQLEAAWRALDRGVQSYQVWNSPEDPRMRAWALAQVRRMLNSHYPPKLIDYKGLKLNIDQNHLDCQRRALELSPSETILLAKLMVANGEPVERQVLARTLVAQHLSPGGLAAHIYRLRKTLETCMPGEASINSTLIGGYRLDVKSGL